MADRCSVRCRQRRTHDLHYLQRVFEYAISGSTCATSSGCSRLRSTLWSERRTAWAWARRESLIQSHLFSATDGSGPAIDSQRSNEADLLPQGWSQHHWQPQQDRIVCVGYDLVLVATDDTTRFVYLEVLPDEQLVTTAGFLSCFLLL